MGKSLYGKALTESDAKQGSARPKGSFMEANMRERSLRRSLPKSQLALNSEDIVKNQKPQTKTNRRKTRKSTHSIGNGGLQIRRKSKLESNIAESRTAESSVRRNSESQTGHKRKGKRSKRHKNKNQRTIAIQTDPWDEPVGKRKWKTLAVNYKYIIRNTKARNINKTTAVVRNVLTMEEYQLQSLKGCPLLCLRFRKSLKRLHEAVTKRQRKIYFESPKESSTSEDSEERDVYSSERDSEWLEYTESEASVDLMEEYVARKNAKKPRPDDDLLNEHCRNLTNAIAPYIWTLKLTGRMPWETYTEDKVQKFRFNPRNIHTFIFILTSSFLLANTFLLGYAVLQQFRRGVSDVEEGYQKEIERLIIDKWNYFESLTLLILIYASIWSAFVIFEDGKRIAEYITQVNTGVDVINYDVTNSLALRVWLHPVWIGFYSIGLTILYLTDYVPAVRGASLLIGSAVLRPFFPNQVIVLSSYTIYKTAEIYGFFLHLYAAVCARHISVLPTIYCKVIENMARFWNLRTTLTLQQGYEDEEGRIKKLQVTIPLKKLWKEHNYIVAFLRQTGRVFNISIGVYLILKFLEFLLLGYRVMAIIAFPLPTFSEEVVQVKLPENTPPIYYTDPPLLLRLAAIYIFIQGFIGWFITTRWIIDCGEAIMAGSELVRRYGFPLSKSSKERRFIASVQNTFGPPTYYFVHAVFTINKDYLYATFFWVCTMISLFTAFAPVHLQTDLVTVCNSNGSCPTVTSTRISMRTSGGSTTSAISNIFNIPTKPPIVSPILPVITPEPAPAPVITLAPTTRAPPTSAPVTLASTTTAPPTTAPVTTAPAGLKPTKLAPLSKRTLQVKIRDWNHGCLTEGWTSNKYTVLRLPHACGDKGQLDPNERYPSRLVGKKDCIIHNGKQERMYNEITDDFVGCDPIGKPPLDTVPRANNPRSNRDDCATPMLSKYDGTGIDSWDPFPLRKPVIMPSAYQNANDILCCFNFGYDGPGEQLSFCNMPTPDYANKNCESRFRFGAKDMQNSVNPHVKRLYNYLIGATDNTITNTAGADKCLCGSPKPIVAPYFYPEQFVPRPKTLQDLIKFIKDGTCEPF